MTERKAIGSGQQLLWHRLRRWFGPWSFAIVNGVVWSPLLTCLLFGLVVRYYGYPLSTFLEGSAAIWLITSPLYFGASLWTWFHMEKRYRSASVVRCPQCGYSRQGGEERCPECGRTT